MGQRIPPMPFPPRNVDELGRKVPDFKKPTRVEAFDDMLDDMDERASAKRTPDDSETLARLGMDGISPGLFSAFLE